MRTINIALDIVSASSTQAGIGRQCVQALIMLRVMEELYVIFERLNGEQHSDPIVVECDFNRRDTCCSIHASPAEQT